MRNINVGVIGLRKGMQHADNFADCSHARLTAICDPDEEKLSRASKQFPRAKACKDYKQLLAMDNLDAAAVAVPNYLHYPITMDLLNAGKHVLCEKPMAMNAEEAVSMKKQAETSGLTLMMHFNMRFMTTGATLKPMVDAGRFGMIYHVTTTYTRMDGYPYPGSWFGKKSRSGGGPLIDLGVHRLDLALWLMGYPRPQSVLGAAHNLLAREKMVDVDFDCEDFAAAMIKFQNGSSLYLASSWDGHQTAGSEVTMKMYGTKASVFERNSQLTFCCEGEDGPKTEQLKLQHAPQTPQQHFIDAVREGHEPEPSAAHGVTVMRIVDAIYQSARDGNQVML